MKLRAQNGRTRLRRPAAALSVLLIAAAGGCASTSGPVGDACNVGLVECGDHCVDTSIDPRHCGGCGLVCGLGQSCVAAFCGLHCPGGQLACNGQCIDPQSEERYCGAGPDCNQNAGALCLAGERCELGVCQSLCPADTIVCDGYCVDPQTDRDYCGARDPCASNPGDACLPGEDCLGGQCELTCPSGQLPCPGRCVDPQTDPYYCGAGPDCAANGGQTCAAGTYCVAGVCVLPCAAGLIPCGGDCVDPRTDRNHCGGCGIACDPVQQCVDASCIEPVVADWIYLTSANGAVGFYGYEVLLDSWSTLASPPSTTKSQLTNDGQSVYLMGSNDTVYQYDPLLNNWSSYAVGPGSGSANPVGFFQWFNGGFYYLQDGTTTLYIYRGGVWTTLGLGATGSCAGGWDQTNQELYLRTYSSMGIQVISTTTDTLARTFSDSTNVGENSRSGSFLAGYFYSREWSGSLQKFDGLSGLRTDTAQTPVAGHTATDSDHAAGLLYIAGYGGQGDLFQVYDPVANVITSLANSPLVSDHSSITVMR